MRRLRLFFLRLVTNNFTRLIRRIIGGVMEYGDESRTSERIVGRWNHVVGGVRILGGANRRHFSFNGRSFRVPTHSSFALVS